MTRIGKIARLPRDIRNQLNRRIADGEPGIRLVAWLNALESVRQVLAQDFGGREITEQNLSEWKQGGYQDWVARQEMLSCARELAGEAAELTEAANGSLADHLAVVLSARYAKLVAGWTGDMDEEFRRQVRGLRTLCQDVVELRRGDHSEGRLKLDWQRFAETNKEAQVLALEATLEETQQWPEVQQAFREAFALFRRRKGGEPGRNPTESNPIQPAAAPTDCALAREGSFRTQ